MTLPKVSFDLIDGALGIVPAGTSDVGVVIGPSTTGDLNTPAAFANGADIIAEYGAGPLVELACYMLKQPGRAVICCRSNATTDGGYGTVDHAGVTGASVPSAHTATKPYDEYDAYVVIVAGGTVGVDGITYKWSLDGGRTLSVETALSTSTTLTIADGNVAFDLTAATLVAGDYWTCRTTPPLEATADLQDAFAAIEETGLDWDFFAVANPQPLAAIQLCDTTLSGWWAKQINKSGFINTRNKSIGESESTYYTAMAIIAAGVTSKYLSVGSGYCRTQSGVNSRQYDRPAVWPCAQRAGSSLITDSARTSIAQVSLGPLPSDVALRDANGNLIHHDERINPGLDDLGFLTLRSFATKGRTGVYVNKDRIICGAGSDFTRRTYRCCINKAADALQAYLEQRLEAPLKVDTTTGYIDKGEANDIEEGALSALKTAIGEGPACSGYSFTVERADNILATSQLRCKARIIPLAYPDLIGVTIGFENPASAIAA